MRVSYRIVTPKNWQAQKTSSSCMVPAKKPTSLLGPRVHGHRRENALRKTHECLTGWPLLLLLLLLVHRVHPPRKRTWLQNNVERTFRMNYIIKQKKNEHLQNDKKYIYIITRAFCMFGFLERQGGASMPHPQQSTKGIRVHTSAPREKLKAL